MRWLDQAFRIIVGDIDLALEVVLRSKLAHLGKSLGVQLLEGIELLGVDLTVFSEVELGLLLREPLVSMVVAISLGLAVFHLAAIAEDFEEVLALINDELLLLRSKLVDVTVQHILLLANLLAIDSRGIHLLIIRSGRTMTHIECSLDTSLNIKAFNTFTV